MGDPLKDLETPAVLLDLDKLESNLTNMQRRADDHGVALRPHAKTHKSIEIGRRQLALGAVGLTVATVDEALVFLKGGVDSITLSRPIVSAGAYRRLFSEAASRTANLRIVVDSEVGGRYRLGGCGRSGTHHRRVREDRRGPTAVWCGSVARGSTTVGAPDRPTPGP